MTRHTPLLAVFAAALAIHAAPYARQSTPPLEPELKLLGDYVASYGQKASVIVAVEKYTQSYSTPEMAPVRPRRLVAEFAIVRADGGWAGFRDVVEVNGEKISDRRDRLEKLLNEPAPDIPEAIRLANESARYNIGPVATNLNLPTTTLLFFQPANLHRFTFTRAGQKKVEGVQTVEFAFKETARPTIVRTRRGADVPLEGSLWIVPQDGTVVRTRLRIRGFSDTVTTQVQQAPGQRPAINPNTPTGGREALAASGFADPISQDDLKSAADIEVTYARDGALGIWLPSKMSEQYEGPIKMGTRPPFQGTSSTRATYSDFKKFGTGAEIKIK